MQSQSTQPKTTKLFEYELGNFKRLSYDINSPVSPAPLPEEDSDELSGSELAAHLQWQLLRLDSMRKAGNKIMQRKRLGKDIFPRGLPENIKIIRHSVFQLSLYDLLKVSQKQL